MNVKRLATLVFLGVTFDAGCRSDEAQAPPSSDIEAGAQSYQKTCALCHGSNGEGYAADNATALRSPTFLATASDDYLARSIARGRPGTTMSAWGRARGGPYDDLAIARIIAFMRTWQTSPNVTAPAGALGDASRGAAKYAASCAACHGATGLEGPNVRLANAELLNVASDDFLRYAIVNGRPGTTMRAWSELTSGDVSDLVALLRSWAKPVPPGDVPIPGTLGPIVQNPEGPEPAFALGQRFTPADTIHAELARGAAMGFLLGLRRSAHRRRGGCPFLRGKRLPLRSAKGQVARLLLRLPPRRVGGPR